MSALLDRPIQEGRYAAIDFESAGARGPSADAPIQVGVARMDGLETPDQPGFVSLIRHDGVGSRAARHVHRLPPETLKRAPTFASLWPQLDALLSNRVLIAHNASSERRFLSRFALHPLGPWVDTLPLTKTIYPGLTSYALGDLILAFGLNEPLRAQCPGSDFHDALFDAWACLLLFQKVVIDAGISSWPLSAILHSEP